MIWKLQDAKNKLSEVINKTLAEGPQTITRHGTETAVVISFEDYEQLKKRKTNLVEFFRDSPLKGQLDLNRDKDTNSRDVEL